MAFHDKLSCLSFLEKNFHIKFTTNGGKENYTNSISIQFDTTKKKKNQSGAQSVERIHALPTAPQVRYVTDWATGGLLNYIGRFNS